MGEKGEKGAKCRSKKAVALLPQLHTEKKATPIEVALCLFLLTEFVQSLLNFFRRWWWRRGHSFWYFTQLIELFLYFFLRGLRRRGHSFWYFTQLVQFLAHLFHRGSLVLISLRYYHHWFRYHHAISPYLDNDIQHQSDHDGRQDDEEHLQSLLSYDCVVF